MIILEIKILLCYNYVKTNDDIFEWLDKIIDCGAVVLKNLVKIKEGISQCIGMRHICTHIR